LEGVGPETAETGDDHARKNGKTFRDRAAHGAFLSLVSNSLEPMEG
jgi:hypothetical protein